jgi:flagellar M-ring protein FliF
VERWIKSFADIPLGQRLILLVAAAASVATIVVTVLWAQRPSLEPLFGSLSTEDAGAIVDHLRDQHVPYELGAGGTSILVPASQVHELRMQLAEAGLPTGGGVGFEIFDRATYGTTDYVQRVNYRRALEGELARTIGAMDQVASARVHLVMPEKRLFAKDQEAARASITLKLRGNGTLADGKVAAIVHLVASAVEGLAPERVTVVDLKGDVLYAGSDGASDTALVGTQVSQRFDLEDRLRQRVLDILEPAVGPGAAEVQVSAELDFTRAETTEEMYDPDVAAIRSEQRTKEQTEGHSDLGGGVTGVTAHPVEAGQSNTTKTQNATVNYELNRTVNHIVHPVGQIKRLSVAVLVDGSTQTGADGTVTHAARTDDELGKLGDLVKKAVGFSAERGDTVEVVNMPFAGAPAVEAPPEPGFMTKALPFVGPALRYLLAAGVAGLVILLILKPLVHVVASGGGGRQVQDLMLPQGLPKTVGQLEAEGQGLLADLGNFESERLIPSSREDVLRMAQDNPRQTAEMLKAWMKEG